MSGRPHHALRRIDGDIKYLNAGRWRCRGGMQMRWSVVAGCKSVRKRAVDSGAPANGFIYNIIYNKTAMVMTTINTGEQNTCVYIDKRVSAIYRMGILILYYYYYCDARLKMVFGFCFIDIVKTLDRRRTVIYVYFSQ